MITNKHNLPEPIYQACLAFQKNYQDSKTGTERFTTTELVSPPYQARLKRQYAGQYDEDVIDRLWALTGQALHKVLEVHETDNALQETRLHTFVDGVEISGQLDFYSDNIISDYKFVSVNKYIFADYTDYTNQLNILAYLMRDAGFEIDKIQVVMIFRDFIEAKKLNPDYPDLPVMVKNLPLWNIEKQKKYISERINLHFDDSITVCNERERWRVDSKFAVMKNDNKRATKLCNSRSNAYEYIERLEDKKNKYQVIERPGEDKRCGKYCPVNIFCEYYKNNYGDDKK